MRRRSSWRDGAVPLSRCQLLLMAALHTLPTARALKDCRHCHCPFSPRAFYPAYVSPQPPSPSPTPNFLLHFQALPFPGEAGSRQLLLGRQGRNRRQISSLCALLDRRWLPGMLCPRGALSQVPLQGGVVVRASDFCLGSGGEPKDMCARCFPPLVEWTCHSGS